MVKESGDFTGYLSILQVFLFIEYSMVSHRSYKNFVFVFNSLFKAVQVVNRRFGNIRQCGIGQKSLVAGNQHIVEGHEPGNRIVLEYVSRMVFEKQPFFFLVHIHPEVADVPCFQGVNHGFGVHQPAPAGVDEHHAGLHRVNRMPVNQVAGMGR